jgi:hypothetical protein
MSKFLILGAALLAVFLAWRAWQAASLRSRLDFIDRTPLPPSLRAQLQREQPGWGEAEFAAVERGLRQFFRLCARQPGAFVAMPSKAVDLAWHAFIVDTRAYASWCERAFGRFLHHMPAEALPAGEAPPRLRQGLRRAWVGACRDEGLDPHRAPRLPLLFALDGDLALAGGYRYAPDCRLLAADRGDTHCGAALACGGGASGSSSGSSRDGDGSGDGGGGDGGGCGGGGD